MAATKTKQTQKKPKKLVLNERVRLSATRSVAPNEVEAERFNTLLIASWSHRKAAPKLAENA